MDPKDNNLIKATIDRLDEPDIDEDVSESESFILYTYCVLLYFHIDLG